MEVVKDNKGHLLAVPFPGQGHVKPLMKLCRQIAKRGIKVTFVNIDRIHDKIVAAAKMSREEEEEEEEDNIVLISIPDGLNPEDDPNNTFKLLRTLKKTMPDSLTGLIERINSSNPDEKISCVIVDATIGWVMETAIAMGVEALLFSPAAAAALTFTLHIPKLLEYGLVDPNGSMKKGEKIILSDGIPAWGEDEITWNFSSNLEIQKIFFEGAKVIETTTKQAKWVLINTCYELESSACDLNPNFVPVGPLLETNIVNKSSYSFHPQDASCLTWLESKPHGSVIYVSFGSLAILSQQQFEELSFGLELSGRHFLWVVRLDLADGWQAVHPDGFLDRVRELGKIVEWAPQEKVLSHRSIACFLSHCGWNSTLEGLSMGVPFLCWPSFADQFHNQKYICDKWEIGFSVDADENGIRSRHEIKRKIDMVFSSDNLKANALQMKELSIKSVSEEGSSYMNFERFIDYLGK